MNTKTTVPTYREHSKPMYSIINAYSNNDLEIFDKKVRYTYSNTPVTYIAEPKVFGVGITIRYENGVLVYITSRGDGATGLDITHNLPNIKQLPIKLLGDDWPSVIEVQGDVFISKTLFTDLNNQSKKQYDSRTDSLVTDLLMGRVTKITTTQRLDLFIYGVGEVSDDKILPNTHHEIINKFSNWGLPTNNNTRLVESVADMCDYFKVLKKFSTELPYELDGIVYKVNEITEHDIMSDVIITRKFLH